MFINMNWLCDFLNLDEKTSIKSITNSLNNVGIEIESVFLYANELKKSIFSEILSIRNLNKNSNISEYKVHIGKKVIKFKSIKKKCKIGDRVACNLLKKKNTKSNYFFVLEKDLELSEKSENILVLNEFKKLKNGDNLVKLNIIDNIFEVGIASNRFDLLSYFGIARDLAAKLRINSYFYKNNKKEFKITSSVFVDIAKKKECSRYSFFAIKNIKVSKTQLKLRMLLSSLKIKSINNIIDALNWIIIKIGQPLHVYDLDKINFSLKKKINIRFAKNKEKMTTFSGSFVILKSNDLIVSNERELMSMAGVMGAKDFEISSKTKNILIESAFFDQKIIKKTSKNHSISTISSLRLEKGVDKNNIFYSLDKLCKIICMFNRKSEIIKNLNICQCKVNIKKQILKFNTLASMIGLSFNKIDKINSFNTFKLLKFVFFKKKASFLIIKIPTYRSDIYREIDLVSEVIRINKLKNLIKRIRLKSERKVRVVNFNNNLVYKISNKFRNILVYNGFSEFINSSLISRKKNLNSPFYKDREEIKIKNPLGINTLCMRQSLIPSLLNNVFFNNSNMISDVRAFEVGSIFRKLKRNEKIWSKNKSLKMFAFEGLCIAFVVYGKITKKSFISKSKYADFFEIKGIASMLLRSIGISDSLLNKKIIYKKMDKSKLFNYKKSSKIFFNKNKLESIGCLGETSELMNKKYNLKHSLYFFELCLDSLFENINFDCIKKVRKYPGIIRDLSLIVLLKTRIYEIVEVIKKLNNKYNMIKDFSILDIYKGKNIMHGRKSISISLLFKSHKSTLRDSEVDEFIKKLLYLLENKMEIYIR